VIVDTTVMEKAVAHPTDSRLLERSREHLVKAAQECGSGQSPIFATEPFQALLGGGWTPPGRTDTRASADHCGMARQGDGCSEQDQTTQPAWPALPAALL
jgi:hypothetical protein